jgi:hypothetical protein
MCESSTSGYSVVDFLHHVAPEDARFHHVGLLHRADLVGPLARQFEGGARHAGDLAFRVALGVDADALVALGMDAARLAEIDAGGQLADDHDVEARDHVLLQRGEIGQRVEALGGAQVGVKVHLLPQTQEPALGLHGEIEHVVFRPANGARAGRRRPLAPFPSSRR